MKHILTIILLSSCSSVTTTTSAHTDGKRVVTTVEKKVDGNLVSKITTSVLGGIVTMFGSRE